jgi:ABC-type nickel/cobalt efflux system permease component RcnA
MPLSKSGIVFALIVVVLAAFVLSGLADRLYLSLLLVAQDWQRLFHDEIASRLRQIGGESSSTAIWGLSAIGFLYGAVHAIGPGHGKIVVSGYLLASRSDLKRGIAITFGGAMMQAIVAIAVVWGLTSLLGLARPVAELWAVRAESLSFALVALVGFVLCWRGVSAFWRLRRSKGEVHHDHHHEHGACSCGCCGHAHAPAPSDIEGKGWKDICLLILSIGFRPCSGALILLLFAEMVGAMMAGVTACFAMAFGTALTTSLLAYATVRFKDFALRLSSKSDDKMQAVHAGLSLAGGLFIVLFGVVFMMAGSSGALSNGDTLGAAKAHPLMQRVMP